MRILIWGTIAVGLVLGVCFTFWRAEITAGYLIHRDLRRMGRGMVKLLYDTDHVAFLAACREVATKSPKSSGPGVISSISMGDAEFQKLPQIILDIYPSKVLVFSLMGSSIGHSDWDEFRIEWLGGIGGFRGVIAFPKDATPEENDHMGDKKLIDGLWYYDEGYQLHPEYDKRLEKLRPR